MVTGPKTGTYHPVGRDIAQVAKAAGLAVTVKPSQGSIENIKRINSNENAALGIVQSDVLAFMGRSKSAETARMAQSLRMILPLYREEVHLLARRGIDSFEDLEGRRVVVGEDGSGHMLTAINLFAMMNVTPGALLKKSGAEGLIALLDNKADAVFFVGGKPVKLFQNLATLKTGGNEKYRDLLAELHFVPLNAPRMLEEYQVSEFTPKDYDFVSGTVPTIAVTAVLVTYDFSGGKNRRAKQRCQQVRELAGVIRKNLAELRSKGHPKWREVKLDEELPIWKRDSCAWPAAAGASKAKKQGTKPKPARNPAPPVPER